jgi:pilus assembly protein CpaE
MSATSGDGSSTVALNTAYSIAQEFKKPTVLIDMDFQFGMVAKNLDVSAPFGIKEIFEHPDRGIDSTLTQRMLVGYGDHLKIISAPNDLRLMPDVRPELVRDLIFTLREQYQYIIIDMPHLWTLWTATAFTNSTHNVLVSQLWLRSVTHASRILNAWRDAGVNEDSIAVTVNRSGAKFKEAVSIKDFERVCNKPVSAFFSNDIKTVVTAENRGKTVFEIEPSPLAKQIRDFARGFLPNAKHSQNTGGEHASPVKSVKSSLFSKK